MSKSSPNIWGVEKTKKYHGGVNTTKIKAVCPTRCNNGWMRLVENATKPILTHLILGQPAVLSKEAQQ
jgi:hypothetical protein